MPEEIQPGNHADHGEYERRDIGVAGIIYFIVGLAVATFVLHLVLAGLYDFLDKRARTHQAAVNPLLENVPMDTRTVAPGYPNQAFPNPRLETDERGQLNDIRLSEERTLNSYGWVDQQAGTVRIPIERAMDLLAERGLPVRTQSVNAQTDASTPEAAESAAGEKNGEQNREKKKKKTGAGQ
jgi:hypothetical protein